MTGGIGYNQELAESPRILGLLMWMRNRNTILIDLAIASAMFVVFILVELYRPVPEPRPWFIFPGMLLAIPLVFAMPRLRASFFNTGASVPSTTYALPRWMIHLALAGLAGQSAALWGIAIWRNDYQFTLASSYTLIGLAFAAGAWQRLSQHPTSEFTMPLFRWPRR